MQPPGKHTSSSLTNSFKFSGSHLLSSANKNKTMAHTLGRFSAESLAQCNSPEAGSVLAPTSLTPLTRDGCSKGKGRPELVSYFPYIISAKNNSKSYLKGKCPSQSSLSSGILDLAAQGSFVSQADSWVVWYGLSMN